jgi:hypothetical protein
MFSMRQTCQYPQAASSLSSRCLFFAFSVLPVDGLVVVQWPRRVGSRICWRPNTPHPEDTHREREETPIGEGKETEWSWKEYLERSLADGAAEAIRMKFCVCDGQHLPGHDALPTPITHCCTLQRFLRGRMFAIKEREEV